MKRLLSASILLAITLVTAGCTAGSAPVTPTATSEGQSGLSNETLSQGSSRILREFPQITGIMTAGAELEKSHGVATYTIYTTDPELLADPDLHTTLQVDKAIKILVEESSAAGIAD